MKDPTLQKFIILGHSFGGYIAANYAFRHKEKIKHLILADSWGILSREQEKKEKSRFVFGFKSAMIATVAVVGFNPNQMARNAGGIGKDLKRLMSPQIERSYGGRFIDYAFYANKEIPPTGEDGFTKISDNYYWPLVSLKDSLMELCVSVPITLLYGKYSKYKDGAEVFLRERQRNITVKEGLNAGHHIHADCPEKFNQLVNEICEEANSTDT